MQFKLDENLPVSTAGPLQAEGYQVDTVAEEYLEGAYDEILAERCREESRVLITLDLDFADIRAVLLCHPKKLGLT